MIVPRSRELKSVPQDAIHTPTSEYSLLNNQFIVCSLVKPPPDVGIFAFIVLTDDTKINLTGLEVLQRSIYAGKQAHGPKIYILAE